MLGNKIYKTIKEGILNGTYKRIRLVKICDNSEREMLITYNGYVRGGEASTIKRLDYIKNQLDRILPPGNYLIECSTVPNGNNGLVDAFKIIKSYVTIPIVQGENKGSEKIEDHTNEQENMSTVDLEEYKDLLKQISKLESIVEVQKLQIEYLKEQLLKAPLSESTGSPVLKMIEEHAPLALSIFDKFLTQRDRGMDLKDRELSLAENGKSLNGHSNNGQRKKFTRMQQQEKSKEEILQDMQALSNNDPDAFEATLDDMEKKNPELYDYICNELGLFDDDSQGQEGGQE